MAEFLMGLSIICTVVCGLFAFLLIVLRWMLTDDAEHHARSDAGLVSIDDHTGPWALDCSCDACRGGR